MLYPLVQEINSQFFSLLKDDDDDDDDVEMAVVWLTVPHCNCQGYNRH